MRCDAAVETGMDAGGRRVVARAIALGVGESSSLSVVQSSTRDGWITRDVNDPTKHRRRRHEGGGGGPASPARLRMFVRPSRFGLSIVLKLLESFSTVMSAAVFDFMSISFPTCSTYINVLHSLRRDTDLRLALCLIDGQDAAPSQLREQGMR